MMPNPGPGGALSAAQLRQFERDGYPRVPGVLDPRTVSIRGRYSLRCWTNTRASSRPSACYRRGPAPRPGARHPPASGQRRRHYGSGRDRHAHRVAGDHRRPGGEPLPEGDSRQPPASLAHPLPASRAGRRHPPDALLELERTTPVPTRRGDLIVRHKRTCHGSLPNHGDARRIGLDLRYNPAGQPTGRVHFPASWPAAAATPPASRAIPRSGPNSDTTPASGSRHGPNRRPAPAGTAPNRRAQPSPNRIPAWTTNRSCRTRARQVDNPRPAAGIPAQRVHLESMDQLPLLILHDALSRRTRAPTGGKAYPCRS